nr:MAG TPA: hypothetical protein [Caudoviricetes sp.]
MNSLTAYSCRATPVNLNITSKPISSPLLNPPPSDA